MDFVQISLSLLLTAGLLLLIKKNRTHKTEWLAVEFELADRLKSFSPVEGLELKLKEVSNKYQGLQKRYKSKLEHLKKSEKHLQLYNTSIGTVDETLYVSKSKVTDLAFLETKLDEIKLKLKDMVREKRACINNCGSGVVVNGKRNEAKKLFNREIKLRLRCLDNEFKAALAVVDWHNIQRLIDKADRLLILINESGEMSNTRITRTYFELKVKELKTHYEIKHVKRLAKDIEREERRLEREQEREQARIENAAKKAEKERLLMEKLVQKEMDKIGQASKEELELIELHRAELEILKNKEMRAKSLAQQTRAGYVYVISNPMSFGENIVKIGMTRRAEPNDRVRELGDASVPDFFTTHAFMYTEDAPTLEKLLHDRFDEERVNKVNNRKEFFNVAPNTVLEALEGLENAPDYQLVNDVNFSSNDEEIQC